MYLCWLLLLVAGAGADTAATIRALDLGIATLLDTLPAQVLTYWPVIVHSYLLSAPGSIREVGRHGGRRQG